MLQQQPFMTTVQCKRRFACSAVETVLDGVHREMRREESGPQVHVRPLGVVHAQTFHHIAIPDDLHRTCV